MKQGGACSSGDSRSINSGSCSMLEAVVEAAVVPYLYITFESLENYFHMICLDVFDNLMSKEGF